MSELIHGVELYAVSLAVRQVFYQTAHILMKNNSFEEPSSLDIVLSDKSMVFDHFPRILGEAMIVFAVGSLISKYPELNFGVLACGALHLAESVLIRRTGNRFGV